MLLGFFLFFFLWSNFFFRFPFFFGQSVISGSFRFSVSIFLFVGPVSALERLHAKMLS